ACADESRQTRELERDVRAGRMTDPVGAYETDARDLAAKAAANAASAKSAVQRAVARPARGAVRIWSDPAGRFIKGRATTRDGGEHERAWRLAAGKSPFQADPSGHRRRRPLDRIHPGIRREDAQGGRR